MTKIIKVISLYTPTNKNIINILLSNGKSLNFISHFLSEIEPLYTSKNRELIDQLLKENITSIPDIEQMIQFNTPKNKELIDFATKYRVRQIPQAEPNLTGIRRSKRTLFGNARHALSKPSAIPALGRSIYRSSWSGTPRASYTEAGSCSGKAPRPR